MASSANPSENLVNVLAVIDCHSGDIDLAKNFKQALLSTVFRNTEPKPLIFLRSELIENHGDESIDEAINNCRCVFVIYTENFSKKHFRRIEDYIEMQDDRPIDNQLIFIPVACEITPKRGIPSAPVPIKFENGIIQPQAIRQLKVDIFQIPDQRNQSTTIKILPNALTRQQTTIKTGRSSRTEPVQHKAMVQNPGKKKFNSMIEMESLDSVKIRPPVSSRSHDSTSFNVDALHNRDERHFIDNNHTEVFKMEMSDSECTNEYEELPEVVVDMFSRRGDGSPVSSDTRDLITLEKTTTEDNCTQTPEDRCTGARTPKDRIYTVKTEENDEEPDEIVQGVPIPYPRAYELIKHMSPQPLTLNPPD